MYNPTQEQFNRIHSIMIDEMKTGDEAQMLALYDLIRAYNHICRSHGWDIQHNIKLEGVDGQS